MEIQEMSKAIELYQRWAVRVGNSDEMEVKIIYKSAAMVGIKKDNHAPYYYDPNEVEWVRKLEPCD